MRLSLKTVTCLFSALICLVACEPETRPETQPETGGLQWAALPDHEDLPQALAVWRHEASPKLFKTKLELVDLDWPSNKYSAEQLMTRFRLLRLRGENEKQEELREYTFIDLEKRRIAPLQNEKDATLVMDITGGQGDPKGLLAHVDLALRPRPLCAKSAAEARWLPLPRAKRPS